MQIYTKIADWEASKESAIALGRFDGVHIGHRAILEYTVEQARERGLIGCCFSFNEISFPGAKDSGILTTSEEKAEILEEIGFDVLLLLEFAPPLIDMSAGDFVKELLVEKWKAKLVVAGYDFHFGKDRGGDSEFLKAEGSRRRFDVRIFDAITSDGVPVKATDIRNLIKEGKIAKASRLLGRPYSIHAKQIPGKGFGRTIGFPTLNFLWPEYKVRPVLGVYAVTIDSGILGKKHKGVANFGVGPTVSKGRSEPIFEVHVLDPDSKTERLLAGNAKNPDTVGVSEIELIDFIRREEKFSSVEELVKRIGEDCESAREIHARHPE
ncbi:MAG: riboflavin biosynthesis protein RibF [bacterium]|nr:riboflavin biosynthesis protein RibF [bacterium]